MRWLDLACRLVLGLGLLAIGASERWSQGEAVVVCERCVDWAPPPAVAGGDAATALERARDHLRQARESSGRRRLLGRLHAVEALRSVEATFPSEPAVGARASAAAAEELLALGLCDESAVAFELALERFESAPESPFWRLGAADARRRGSDYAAALPGYALAGADVGLPGTERDRAQLWFARCLRAIDRPGEAESILIALAHDATDPVRSIDAYDELALAAVSIGDVAGAAGWIDACRRRHAASEAEHTPTGDRVRRALMRMSSVVELRCAVFERDSN